MDITELVFEYCKKCDIDSIEGIMEIARQYNTINDIILNNIITNCFMFINNTKIHKYFIEYSEKINIRVNLFNNHNYLLRTTIHESPFVSIINSVKYLLYLKQHNYNGNDKHIYFHTYIEDGYFDRDTYTNKINISQISKYAYHLFISKSIKKNTSNVIYIINNMLYIQNINKPSYYIDYNLSYTFIY